LSTNLQRLQLHQPHHNTRQALVSPPILGYHSTALQLSQAQRAGPALSTMINGLLILSMTDSGTSFLYAATENSGYNYPFRKQYYVNK